MHNIKLIGLFALTIILFISCDNYPDDAYSNHIAFDLPNKDGIAEVEVGEEYRYIGEIHHGPAETIEIKHSKRRSDENYTGWLKGELINDGNSFKIKGIPDTVDTFHFIIKVKRKDSTAKIGSYSLGFNVEVAER